MKRTENGVKYEEKDVKILMFLFDVLAYKLGGFELTMEDATKYYQSKKVAIIDSDKDGNIKCYFVDESEVEKIKSESEDTKE